MSQSFNEKCAAIQSLLALVYWHLDLIPCAMKPTPAKWVSEPSPLDEPTPPRVEPRDCSGRCYTCRAFGKAEWTRAMCPPEEHWVAEAARLRRLYRIADVEESLDRLAYIDVVSAQCVWAVYVEPWPEPKTEPIAPASRAERDKLAADGIRWMAHDIRDDVLGFGEKIEPIENQIRQLASQGFAQRRIARELRCGRDKIRAVLCAQVVRRG